MACIRKNKNASKAPGGGENEKKYIGRPLSRWGLILVYI